MTGTPAILSTAAIGGKKELEGPLHAYFDELSRDTRFRQRTWEKAESKNAGAGTGDGQEQGRNPG